MPQFLATYRLQLHGEFNLKHAESLVDYLAQLGISHVYSSPMTRARRGSRHGYDVTDPASLNPELGSPADLNRFIGRLHQNSMGLLLDIVPNHMATGAENRRWEDVLTHGQTSQYARWFDIDWRSRDPELRGRILLPVLSDVRHKVLARGEINLCLCDGVLRVIYFDHTFPTDPATWPMLLEFGQESAGETNQPGLLKVRRMLEQIPPRRGSDPLAQVRRRQAAESAKEHFRELVRNSAELDAAIKRMLVEFSSGNGGVRRLTRFLDRQAYRLAYWRRAAREINYRRFFDINDLIAVRADRQEVFEDTHSLIFRWSSGRVVNALRVDHVDGLIDPRGYLERLAARAGPEIPIFVEKILARGEELRDEWPVAGTTGYDFLNQVESILVDPGGVRQIEAHYRKRILQQDVQFAEVARRFKRRALKAEFSAAVGRLARQWLDLERADREELRQDCAGAADGRVGRQTRTTARPEDAAPVATVASGASRPALDKHRSQDVPEIDLADAAHAITEFVSALDVYRTYVQRLGDHCGAISPDATSRPDSIEGWLNPRDRAVVSDAIAKVKAGPTPPVAIDRLATIITMGDAEYQSPAARERRLKWIARLQQLTGPAAAKGVEDTAFYVYVPLVSLNEVGGLPGQPTDQAVTELHESNRCRWRRHPHSLLAVTTHDTKRSADVRARLDVLSEAPGEWVAATRRWSRMNRRHRRKVAGQYVPDANTEYLLYQTLVGAWPLRWSAGDNPGCGLEFRGRIEGYMIKAVREAKVRSSWTNPDEPFERALVDFVQAILSDAGPQEFLADLTRFVVRIARPGLWNSLSRTLIQLTSPGTPDIYQGDELWNFSLVDPDNRRPVDFELRRELLRGLKRSWPSDVDRGAYLSELVADAEDGRIKLHLIHRVLQSRQKYPDVFLSAGYTPLPARGPLAEHLFAFARHARSGVAITIAPRLTRRLMDKSLNESVAPAGLGEATAPVGPVWTSTEIIVPEDIASSIRSLESALTGETVVLARNAAGDAMIPVKDALRHAPVALLLAVMN